MQRDTAGYSGIQRDIVSMEDTAGCSGIPWDTVGYSGIQRDNIKIYSREQVQLGASVSSQPPLCAARVLRRHLNSHLKCRARARQCRRGGADAHVVGG
jgi:hypothetical protein